MADKSSPMSQIKQLIRLKRQGYAIKALLLSSCIIF